MKPKSIKFARMTIHEANNRLLFQMYHLYNNSEAANIADLVMEKITGWKRIDRVLNKHVKMSAAMQNMLDEYTQQLMEHKPVQYVLNEAWFFGVSLYVDENVLIPRPETEELVEWVLKSVTATGPEILDIGTGSGCIPVAIKKNNASSKVYACDINENAIGVAQKNATLNNVVVEFIKCDVLDESAWSALPDVDVIVSNPPYIPFSEMDSMEKNVTAHEPHLALFVDDSEPLIFYKALAAIGKVKLRNAGRIFVEVHEQYANDAGRLFEEQGYSDVEVRKDMQGKERFVGGKLKVKA